MTEFFFDRFTLLYLGVELFGGIILAVFHHLRSKGEMKGEMCYEAHTNGYLPQLMLMAWIGFLVLLGIQPATHWFVSSSFAACIQLSLYYLILIPLMPMLQKRIRATTCVVLWLLPNWIYLFLMPHISVWRESPALILHIPSWVVRIWLIGFCFLLLYHIVNHLRFRRQILQDAHEVTESHILSLCEEVRREVGSASGNVGNVPSNMFRIVRSPAIHTPLSIGFFKKTIRLVLPDKEYTPDELRLILMHECVHISRHDSISKWVMTFCTALSWFNPLVWFAMRKCAENLELSCDETVLLHADEATRRRYADLILTTAGDSRGFTTCLSATAGSLRYRLKNIMAARRSVIGAWLLPIGLMILSLGFGSIALAYGESTGNEVIFRGKPEDYTLESASRKVWILDPCEYIGTEKDAEIIKSQLADLELYQLTGRYIFNQSDVESYSFVFQSQEEKLYVTFLAEHELAVYHHYDSPFSFLFCEEYRILSDPEGENPLAGLFRYFEPLNTEY